MPTKNFLKQFNDKEVEIYCSQNNIRGKVQTCKNGLLTIQADHQEITIPTKDVLGINTTTML